MAIKISELSVGDWVRCGEDTTPYKIIGIDSNVHPNVTLCDSYYPQGVIAFLDMIHPIPITTEMLKKNGFEKSRYYWTAYHDNGDYVEIYNDGDKWYLSVNSVEYILCPLHWVHQIQHLLRVWGIDKEINL